MSETITCYDGEKIVLTKKKMNKINAICNDVLKEIKPKPKDTAKVLVSACKVMKAINRKDIKCFLGGSVGKGTNLR